MARSKSPFAAPVNWSATVTLLAMTVAVWPGAACSNAPSAPIEIERVRFATEDEPKFQIDETRGLIVPVRINELQGEAQSKDFRLLIPNEKGEQYGLAPLAMGIPAAGDPQQRWMLLTEHEGTIKQKGRYEFVYLISPRVKEASLQYQSRSIGSFTVPW